jgi:site-specific recombinase XerD
LKVIASITGIRIVLRTHKARFFFANEVTYNNGVPLKTISRMLGQKSVKTTEIYVRANRQNISANMDMVEEKLFTEQGELKIVRANFHHLQRWLR